MSKKEDRFLMVLSPIAINTGLTWNEKAVLSKILGFTRFGNLFIGSNKYLSEELGMSERTIKRILKSLQDKGYLNTPVLKRKGKIVVKRIIKPTDLWKLETKAHQGKGQKDETSGQDNPKVEDSNVPDSISVNRKLSKKVNKKEHNNSGFIEGGLQAEEEFPSYLKNDPLAEALFKYMESEKPDPKLIFNQLKILSVECNVKNANLWKMSPKDRKYITDSLSGMTLSHIPTIIERVEDKIDRINNGELDARFGSLLYDIQLVVIESEVGVDYIRTNESIQYHKDLASGKIKVEDHDFTDEEIENMFDFNIEDDDE